MMHASYRTLLAGATLTTLACGPAFAGDAAAKPAEAAKPAAAARPADAKAAPDPAMAAMIQAAAPGPNHDILKGMAGTWTVTNKAQMDPSQPAVTSTGKATKKMILGGRYLQEEADSTFLGMPFQGIGLSAYDNVQKKFVGTWIDNMGTGIATMTATSSDGKTMAGGAAFWDPMTGKETIARTVTRIESPDKHIFEWWSKGPDGKEFLGMHITYERTKQTVASAPKK